MARMMNALQLALGSVGSGIQGYAQARAQREEQERKQAELEQEQSRVAAAFERQSRMDTMAMEDREQAKQDRLQAQRAALLKGGYVPTGMDMPGATPRKAVSTEMVDGQEYNLYSTPRQLAMQAAMEEAARKAKFDPTTPPIRYTEGEGGLNVFNPKTGTSTFQPFAKGFTPKKPAERSGKPELSDERKRQLGNQYMASQARNPALMAALQNTFANDPEAAADPGLAAYDLMQSKMIPKLGAGKGYEPPKPSKNVSGLDAQDQAIRDEIARRKAGKSGASASVPPAAPVPVKKPTAEKPAIPAAGSVSDAAYKESQRADLWDSLKAQNPSLSDDDITAQVMQRIP